MSLQLSDAVCRGPSAASTDAKRRADARRGWSLRADSRIPKPHVCCSAPGPAEPGSASRGAAAPCLSAAAAAAAPSGSAPGPRPVALRAGPLPGRPHPPAPGPAPACHGVSRRITAPEPRRYPLAASRVPPRWNPACPSRPSPDARPGIGEGTPPSRHLRHGVPAVIAWQRCLPARRSGAARRRALCLSPGPAGGSVEMAGKRVEHGGAGHGMPCSVRLVMS